MLTVTIITSRAAMTHSSEERSGKEMERRGCTDLGIMEKTPSVSALAYSTPAV